MDALTATVTIIVAVISGGIGTMLIKTTVEAWRSRQQAKAHRETALDRHQRYEHEVAEAMYLARRLAIEHGVPPDQLGPVPTPPDR